MSISHLTFFISSRQLKTAFRHSLIYRSKTHGTKNGCLCPVVVLLQCGWGTESNYAGGAPDRRPGGGRAEWFFCSGRVFPRCREVVTHPAAGRKRECAGACGRSTPW